MAEAKKARVIVGPISAEKLTKLVLDIYSASPKLVAELRANLKPGAKLARAKPTKVKSQVIALKKKGKLVVFKDGGKTAQAKVGRRTKIYIGKKKVKRKALKAGMTCDIAYFKGGLAKTIKCK